MPLSSTTSGARYRLRATLVGHTAPVFALRFSPTGKLLASGGTDGVRLWDVKTGSELPVPTQDPEEYGQATYIAWLTSDGEQLLSHGTSRGYFVIWLRGLGKKPRFSPIAKLRLGTGREITSIIQEHLTEQIGVGCIDGVVQVWHIDPGWTLTNVFSVQIANFLPKTLSFVPNARHDLHVFSWGNGYCAETAVSPTQEDFVVDNCSDGFDLHSLTDGRFIRKFTTPPVRHTRLRQVQYVENGRMVVAGHTEGGVYVFGKDSGKQVDYLQHCNGGMVATIGTCDTSKGSLIACADTEVCPIIKISIWSKRDDSEERPQRGSPRQSLHWAMHAIMVVMVVAWTTQYFGIDIEPQRITKAFYHYGWAEYMNPAVTSWLKPNVGKAKTNAKRLRASIERAASRQASKLGSNGYVFKRNERDPLDDGENSGNGNAEQLDEKDPGTDLIEW
ncbi:WD40 repeat-like protein [Heliocybe sulcata]|uniref:WD40 repeat-like protein n=1 Tax=Heliocybe sulcata TaxID=5364 RepID=A0A5C3MLP5_9AGAM|nr:WD40 repeat-like protein [Heliocybe sulcata]